MRTFDLRKNWWVLIPFVAALSGLLAYRKMNGNLIAALITATIATLIAAGAWFYTSRQGLAMQKRLQAERERYPGALVYGCLFAPLPGEPEEKGMEALKRKGGFVVTQDRFVLLSYQKQRRVLADLPRKDINRFTLRESQVLGQAMPTIGVESAEGEWVLTVFTSEKEGMHSLGDRRTEKILHQLFAWLRGGTLSLRALRS